MARVVHTALDQVCFCECADSGVVFEPIHYQHLGVLGKVEGDEPLRCVHGETAGRYWGWMYRQYALTLTAAGG